MRNWEHHPESVRAYFVPTLSDETLRDLPADGTEISGFIVESSLNTYDFFRDSEFPREYPRMGEPMSMEFSVSENQSPISDAQAEWTLTDEYECGPIEKALRDEIRRIRLVGHLPQTVKETAYSLARKLDNDAGMATAAVARELRAYVEMIEKAAGDDDDTRDHGSDLSTPV